MSLNLNDLKKAFEEYLDLNYVKSRLDPEDEPFKTKYEARKLLEKQLENLNKQCQQNSYPDIKNETSSEFMGSIELKHLINTYEYFYEKLNPICQTKFSCGSKVFLIVKLFEFNLAKNFIETEERETGEKLILKIVQQMDQLDETNTQSDAKTEYNLYNPLVYNLKLSCLMELVFIWSHRSEYKQCLQLLNSIDEIYGIYKSYSVKNYLADTNELTSVNQDLNSIPFDPSELIFFNKNMSVKTRRLNFESLYTHSLFYSAQVYGKLDDKQTSAFYCQLTLQRQMNEHNESTEEESNKNIIQQLQESVLFIPLDWATHAAALSQYYVCQNDFSTARHCLCCADAILKKLNEDSTGKEDEKLAEQTQSIKRCWGKYAIEILKAAKYKLLASTEMSNQKSLKAELDKPSRFHFNLPASLYKLAECEINAITSNIPLDFEQARKIFLKAQTILEDARNYFKMDGFVTDHCEITRDISELYSCLIFFESDGDRRSKMYKRRLDLLIPICDEINSQFYLTLKRQLLFDIGTIYSDMMDTKLDLFKSKKETNSLTPIETKNYVKKINQLANNGIERFETFLETMKVQPKREVLPEKFDDHNVRPALLAKFYLGRFYSKIITLEPAKRLSNMKNTLESYTYLVNYCDKYTTDENTEVMDNMINEYNVCKEMIVFLPAQMEKVRLQIV